MPHARKLARNLEGHLAGYTPLTNSLILEKLTAAMAADSVFNEGHKKVAWTSLYNAFAEKKTTGAKDTMFSVKAQYQDLCHHL